MYFQRVSSSLFSESVLPGVLITRCVRRGKEPLSFEEAIAAEEQRLTQAKEELARALTGTTTGCWLTATFDRGVYCSSLKTGIQYLIAGNCMLSPTNTL